MLVMQSHIELCRFPLARYIVSNHGDRQEILVGMRLFFVACALATASALRPSLRTPPPRASVSESTQPAPAAGRLPLALLAAAGAVETGAITADKLSGANALAGLCSAAGGGCADVLNSPWADVAGVPLALFGAIAYSAVALLAAAPLVSAELEEPSAGPLIFGSAALASFSGCLMLLLAVVIQQPCALCFASAGISAALGVAAWRTPLLADRTESTVLAACGAAVSVVAAAVLYGVVDTQEAAFEPAGPGQPPIIRSHSSRKALDLASELQARGGRFYGAWWCSHCANQKETLGIEAMKSVPYLECDENGKNSRRSECVAAGVKGYPTWQVDGKLFPGEKDLGEIEEMLAGKLAAQVMD